MLSREVVQEVLAACSVVAVLVQIIGEGFQEMLGPLLRCGLRQSLCNDTAVVCCDRIEYLSRVLCVVFKSPAMAAS